VAAFAGHKDVAEVLLANKADVDAKDNTGRTPLHLAADRDHKDVAELLLASQADVNTKANDGSTALHLAAFKGREDVVELLLANKAEVNAKDRDGMMPLHYAEANGYKDVAELLRQHGGQELSTPVQAAPAASAQASGTDTTTLAGEIHDAAQNGYLANVEALIKDNPDLVFSKDIAGATPLLVAAAKGHRDVAELLLAHNAEVDAKANNGRTPLHMAASNGHQDVVELLLGHKAEVNAKDSDGMTPLHYAAANSYKDVAELLRQHGGQDFPTPNRLASGAYPQKNLNHALVVTSNTDVATRDDNGRTPLILAADDGDTIRRLIAAGADVNAKANDGMTALMASAQLGMEDCINILIGAGAAIDAKDNRGWTALMFVARSNAGGVGTIGPNGRWIPAQGYSRKGSASALIAAGADIKARDKDGATALMGATIDTDCVKLLIAQGADVNARDNNGKTVIMHLALPVTNPSVAKLLVASGADVNARDNDGKTALMWASTYVITMPRTITAPDGRAAYLAGIDRKVGNIDLVAAMIATGADVNARDNAGKSVISLARAAKSSCVHLLKAAHAK
jgi:ankyrin repeat protein